MRKINRFLACRRGTVALESVLATIPLILCLVGVFEIVHALFAGDLLQRAAHRVARQNALTASSDTASLESLVRQAITDEVGGWLDFELTMEGEGTCGESADYCLIAHVDVYDSLGDMVADTKGEGPGKSQKAAAALGGEVGDTVLVRMQLKPQSVLSELQQILFGTDGLRAVAMMQKEDI